MKEKHDRRFGVVVYYSGCSENEIEVRLDDLKFSGGDLQEWRHWAFFTTTTLDRQRAISHSLTEKEYAAIGKAVIARLSALRLLIQEK